MIPQEVKDILNSAAMEISPTYETYEFYKNILTSAGYFGYEALLADALQL